MKRKSISRKIQKQMLMGSVVSALSVCLAAVIAIVIMRGSVIGISEELGESAAVDSAAALEEQMEQSLLLIAQNRAAISDEKLTAVASMVEIIARNAEGLLADPAGFMPRTPGFPSSENEGVVVSQLRLPEDADFNTVADEAGLMGNLSDLLVAMFYSLDYVRSVYIGTELGVSISADVDSHMKTNIFDPRIRPWYQEAKASGELIWSDIFVDASAGRGLTISCAIPFFGTDGEMRGVAGAGMTLEILQDIVLETNLGETGYVFIANEQGDMIISRTFEIDENNNPVSRNLHDLFPAETVRRILGGNGVERAYIDGDEFFVAHAHLTALPWSLVALMSVEEIIAPAAASEMNIIGMTQDAVSGIDSMIVITLGVFAAAMLLTLLGNGVLARRLASGLAKPIVELSRDAGIIGAGNLDYRLNIKTGDELEMLAVAFNTMIDSIKTITADKERIGAELNVATRIQASMLPCIFPAFPGRTEFDIYAAMIPAKEVGGDFYDFFLVGEDKLAVVMADVSGKGVPAALFMVIAKTLLKNNAQYGKKPVEVFETVNDLLCDNNEVGMFVTVFMGIMDIPTGKFIFANAGHNPPLIKRADGDYEYLPAKPGFVLAGMEGMTYEQGEITLHEGDCIFMYTDGVTEAENREKELFGDDRLLATANANKDRELQTLAENIKAEIDCFANGAEQADDITMLVLKRGAM